MGLASVSLIRRVFTNKGVVTDNNRKAEKCMILANTRLDNLFVSVDSYDLAKRCNQTDEENL